MCAEGIRSNLVTIPKHTKKPRKSMALRKSGLGQSTADPLNKINATRHVRSAAERVDETGKLLGDNFYKKKTSSPLKRCSDFIRKCATRPLLRTV
jgi:hypothetical protein